MTGSPPAADARSSPDPVRREYARLAARYDRRWAAYNARSLALLRPYLADADLGAVLDVGCGTANLLPRLADWRARFPRYVGVDLSPEMLEVARGKLPSSPVPPALAAASAAELPLRDAAFDTVVTASALHDFARPDAALAEIRRVLRPGGRLLLLDWSRDRTTMKALNLFLRVTGNPCHRMYSPDEAAALVENAGLRIIRHERRAITWLWELMVIEATAT